MIDRNKPAKPLRFSLMFAGLLFCAGSALAPMPQMQKDKRTEVKFPPMVRQNFLRHMRDHLAAISEIQSALGQGNFRLAADTAKNRLGMGAPSSMACNPNKAKMSGMEHMSDMNGMSGMSGMDHMNGMATMSQMSKYMPASMRKAGRTMHRAADQFAVDAQAGNYQAAIASLAKVTHACAACHAQYRVR